MRITQEHLQKRVAYLRERTGKCYLLDAAYGGYRLVRRVSSEDMTETDISERMSARELNTFISGMMHGLDQ